MANNHEVEIIVHIDDSLGDERKGELVRGLEMHDAVNQARFTPGRPHLVLVNYDATRIHTWDVLDYVRKEYVSAELIGGI